jgi:hypothetical protein
MADEAGRRGREAKCSLSEIRRRIPRPSRPPAALLLFAIPQEYRSSSRLAGDHDDLRPTPPYFRKGALRYCEHAYAKASIQALKQRAMVATSRGAGVGNQELLSPQKQALLPTAAMIWLELDTLNHYISQSGANLIDKRRRALRPIVHDRNRQVVTLKALLETVGARSLAKAG